MEYCCKNCKHCHQTKELVNKEWKYSYVCTLYLDWEETHEPLLLTLRSIDRANVDLCECIELKEK